MRTLVTILSLLPTPVFFVCFVFSIVNIHLHAQCGSTPWEMPLMWFTMSLAHSTSWFLWYSQRKLRQLQTLAVKQQ